MGGDLQAKKTRALGMLHLQTMNHIVLKKWAHKPGYKYDYKGIER